MLAVVISPHGSITVLMDAATLSQTRLIQPGRALGAEPQVRASFHEFLQLHMQLFVSHQNRRYQALQESIVQATGLYEPAAEGYLN